MPQSVAAKPSKSVRAGRARLGETFVLMAMSLVAVAVGVGLYMQFEAGFLLALLATCTGYLVLLSAHVLLARAQKVVQLEAEVVRLNMLVHEMQRSDPRRLEPRDPGLSANHPSPPDHRSRLAETAHRSAVDLREPTLADPPLTQAIPQEISQLVSPEAVALALQSLPEDAREPEAAAQPAPSIDLQPASPRSGVEKGSGVGASDVETREFETMQVLIQQLAAKLNAPASAADDKADGSSEVGVASSPEEMDEQAHVTQVTDHAIGHSAAMLRSAAGRLRRMDDAPRDQGEGAARAQAVGNVAAQLARPIPAPVRPPSPYDRLALIKEAIQAQRFDVYLDPILGLGERRARHFEVSVQLRVGDALALDTAQYASIAAGSGLLPQIDQAKLERTARVADRLRARDNGGALFSTLAGESLGNEQFQAAFRGLVAADMALVGRLVLSFTQRDVRAFTRMHWDAISSMSAVGLKLALEDVSDLDMDFEHLAEKGFDFVKLDARVFLEGLPAAGGPIPAADICRHLSGYGLTLIVGRIEDERDLAKIVGFGALLGQGSLFGAPRPVKVDVAGARDAA